MELTVFKKLGLSDKEIKVYLGLIKSGAISVRGLSEKVSLNRGTVYDMLKRLQEKGLASFYLQETKQKFVAEEPERLMRLVQEREERLEEIKDNFGSLIPELRSLMEKGGNRPTSKFYEGKTGIKQILEDVLATTDLSEIKEYYIYSATNVSDDINAAYPNFTKYRIRKKIRVKAISLAEGGGLSGLDERRWLGTKEDSATYSLIYNGKVAFISRDTQNKPVGVIIENNLIYDTQKLIFLQLWKCLK